MYDGDVERIVQEAVLTVLKGLSRESHGRTEENHEKYHNQ
jgi:hypothetical protein